MFFGGLDPKTSTSWKADGPKESLKFNSIVGYMTSGLIRPFIFIVNPASMLIIYIVIAYLLMGTLFSAIFVARLVARIDESTAASSWTFRLIILPGCIVFWPLLLKKYIRARRESSND